MGIPTALAVLLLIMGTGVAGCIDPVALPGNDDGSPEPPGTEGGPEIGEQSGAAANGSSAGDGGVNDTGSASGGDNATTDPVQTGEGERYELGLSQMRWSHTNLSVLIVPPSYGQVDPGQLHPDDSVFLRAVEDSITHWQEAIDEHGSDELQGNVSFDVHVLGRDIVSPAELSQVDIHITNPAGGVVLAGLAAYPLKPRCMIANFVNPAQDYRYMFGVSAHEFGHCLGLSHPVDHEPWQDLMSYSWMNQGDDEEDLALDCVSNMNLMAVHEAFGPAFDRQASDPVVVYESDYELIDCADRFLGAL